MTQYLAYAFGVLGILFGARCYLELWRWARHCQRAKVAIAYNRRVQITAPLTEILAWANQLDDDERSKGRVFYRNGKVAVAVLRPDVKRETTTTARTFRRIRRRKRKESVPA